MYVIDTPQIRAKYLRSLLIISMKKSESKTLITEIETVW